MRNYNVEITVVAKVFGDGQRVIKAILAFPYEMNVDDIKNTDFIVEGRTVSAIHGKGHEIVLELSEKDENASTIYFVGKGPNAKFYRKEPSVTIKQVVPLYTKRGEYLEPWKKALLSQNINQELVEEFEQVIFHDPITNNELPYNLFLPDKYNKNKKYPLVLFMHDMGVCSDDVKSTLVQGLGAVAWAEPKQQQKQECIILAPQYANKVVNDEYEVSWEAEATIRLVEEVKNNFGVDKERVYATGQSMGCMMLCELNARHPEYFTASLLVAGQWNPEIMMQAKDNNLFILVSQGDLKAFPGMNNCVAAMENAGAKVTRRSLYAKATNEALNEQIADMRKEGNSILYAWFEGDSVIPEGVENHPGNHHIKTWAKAYSIEGLRDWLLEQRH